MTRFGDVEVAPDVAVAGGDRGTKEAVRALLPFLEATGANPIDTRFDAVATEQLRRFFLFKVSGLVVPQEVEDLQRFLEQRFLSVLSAAHRAGWTVLTAVVGSASGVELNFGFMTDASVTVSAYNHF